MTVSETLVAAWKALREEVHTVPGVYERRVFGQTKYSVFAAISHPAGLSQLMFVVDRRSVRGRLDLETKAFTLDVEPYAKGQVQVRLRLARPAFADLYQHLCADVTSSFLSSGSEELAVEALRARVGHWQRFMQTAGDQGLSAEGQLGLYGELVVLKRLIEAGSSPVKAIEGWQGPLGANQDFMFGTAALEVKSTATNIESLISVTSERQLDDTGLENLFLCHLSFDRRKGTPGTLPALVEEIENLVGNTLVPAFEDRLLAAGYHRAHRGLYLDVGYTKRKLTHYRVSALFPRIVPKDLRAGVEDVRYSVQLPSATDFVMPEDRVFAAIV